MTAQLIEDDALPEGVSFRRAGEGALGGLIASKDWGKTSLGPIDRWPELLRGYVRMILALPSPAIIFWGPEQVQLYNDGYAVIMGPRHPQHLGSTYRECWPDTYPTIYPWMQRVLAGEVVLVDRTLIPTTRYGALEDAFFNFTFSPLRDAQGKVAGILQLVTEITETVLAERRERTVRELSVPNDLALLNDDRRMLDAVASNPQDTPFAAYFRAQPNTGNLELISHVGLGAAPLAPLEQQALAAFAQRGTAGRLETDDWAERGPQPHSPIYPEPVRTVVALPVRGAGEQVRGVLVLAVNPRLRFDEPYREYFARLARDVGTREAAAQQRFLAEQLQLALDSAKMGTWHVDLRSNRLRISPRLAAFLGSEASEGEFNQVNAARVHADDQANVDAAIQTAIENGTPYETEYRIVRPDGEIRWLDSWGRASYGERGQPLTFSGVTLDVTDRKRDEANLRDAVRARDEFMSLASHELKTPLTALRLASQSMARHLKRDPAWTPAPAQLGTFLQQIDRQSVRLARLVDDMLDVARIRTGRLTLRKQRVSLVPLVSEAVDRMRPQFDAAGVPLSLETGVDAVGWVDPDRLDQVISNLLTNALRYGRRSPVRVQFGASTGGAELIVEDRGPGISPSDQGRIFQRFERAIDATEVSGLGLGLFISQQIVEGHGGRIRVESSPGQGARFVVELPLGAAPEG